MGRWSKSLYISSLQYTPFEFLFEKCRGSSLKKVSPESLKLNIFSLCLSNCQRKGVAETCLTGWNIILRKQLELSLVKGFRPIQPLDGSDLDKGWDWAWQFALPSRMIVEPKKLDMFKKLKDYSKICWHSKFPQKSTKTNLWR